MRSVRPSSKSAKQADLAVHEVLLWAQEPRWSGKSAANDFLLCMALCRVVSREGQQTVMMTMRAMADEAQIRWHQQVIESARRLAKQGVLHVDHVEVEGHRTTSRWTLAPGYGLIENAPLTRLLSPTSSLDMAEPASTDLKNKEDGAFAIRLLRPAKTYPAAWLAEGYGALGLMLHQAVCDGRLSLFNGECAWVTVSDCVEMFGMSATAARRGLQKMTTGPSASAAGQAARYLFMVPSPAHAFFGTDAETAYAKQCARRDAEVAAYREQVAEHHPATLLAIGVERGITGLLERPALAAEASAHIEARGGRAEVVRLAVAQALDTRKRSVQRLRDSWVTVA